MAKRTPRVTQSFAKAGNDNRSFEYKISAAERARALKPPVDNDHVDLLHGKRVSDPFRPLEDLKSAETTAWVNRQNKKFEDFVSPSKKIYEQSIDYMMAAMPKGMYESMPSYIAKDVYSCWRRKEGEDRLSFFIKSTPDYDAPARLLLDPAKIDPSGKTDITGAYFNKDAKILAYTLSVSGSDENTIHFMDVATGKPIDLHYPPSRHWRNGLRWAADGQSFTYTAAVDGLEKSSRTMQHVLGTDPSKDTVIYSPTTAETSASFYRLRKDMTDQEGAFEFISEWKIDRTKNRVLLRKAGSSDKFAEIFPHASGTLSPITEIDGKIYALTSHNAPLNKLVRIDPAKPQPENWKTIIPEHATDPLENVFAWQGKLFACYKHDTADKVRLFDTNGKPQGEMPLPALTTSSFGQVRQSENTCLISLSGFQEDGAIYKYDAAKNTLALHRASRRPVDLKDCIVERVFATSKDGTKVPMTVIRAPDTKLDGTAATILYGYGGFNVALEPRFMPQAAFWVRQGGIFVQANLRGGGEFGQKWYEDGRHHKKQNVFDDFAACAQHLIDNKYTSQPRLAIQGGSNGGLLTLATGIQRPDLFGAIVSEVPVTDMHRFHVGSFFGYSWKGDYGDPGIKADFNRAAKYSPYHNVQKGFAHPPILINTDANDDRVMPWHSYKMTALLQAREDKASVTVMKVALNGGHGGGGSIRLRFESTATVFSFLEKTLGPINQRAYRASITPVAKEAGLKHKKG